MSASTTHDPLVVNTQDGSCWMRRALTREGRGLYALAGSVAGCPGDVLSTLAELAEHGIVGSADVLPEPQASPVDADRAKAPWGRGEDGRPLLPMGAHWTDVPELVDRTLAGIKSRVDQAQSGHWYVASDTETWRPPGTVCTRVDGYHRTVGQFTNMLPADLELVLHAHDDLSWCLEMLAKLRARVAGLEAERHVTNEALDDAMQALRERQTEREALVERMRAGQTWQRGRNPELVSENHVSQSELREIFGIPETPPWENEPAPKCRCDEADADPYACEADDCTGEFSELNPFGGGSGPVEGRDAKVSRTCGCGWKTSVWHVNDGSAEEELHGHVIAVHGGVYPAGVNR